MPKKPAKPGPARETSGKVPWPDAFSPRPNYQSGRKSPLWYWLFLIPFAGVVAVAITLIDPSSIRTFIDQTLPQYLPDKVTKFFARPASPARPEAFPPVLRGPESPVINLPDAPPATPPTVPPVVEQPTPASPPTPAPATPAPAEPASQAAPPETPPAAVAVPSPPPSDAPAAPEHPSPPVVPSPARAPRVTVYYRRNQPAAENEARRVAAKAGNAEIKPSATTARSPIIFYFNAADREEATALARTLAGTGTAGWIVRAGPTRPNPGAIDVLLP